MDQELIAFFERKFDEAREQQRADLEAFRQEVSTSFGQVDKRFKGLEEDVRQSHVLIEDVRGEVRLVAEGVANVDEKLERFREDQTKEHAETRALLKASYSDLDQRVTRLGKRAAGGRLR